MRASTAFFSFTEVPDPADHRAYNEWHQLDHRPENLALPGVVHGERWVHAPDCAATTGPELRDLHYVNMYWFEDARAFADWQELAQRSFQWGRRVDTRISRRLLMGTFSPVKGYASSRVRVGPDALPYRPNTGVHLRVTRLADPRGTVAHDLFAWYDQVHIPRLLARPGVAGVWTFASRSTTLDEGIGGTTFEPGLAGHTGAVRVQLSYLDGDMVDHVADRPEHPAETVLFDGVLRAITPWQWDCFA